MNTKNIFPVITIFTASLVLTLMTTRLAMAQLGLPSILPIIPISFSFQNNLQYGETKFPDVNYLQNFLNQDSRTAVSDVGPGSMNELTSYFGQKTKEAVNRFQQLFAADILAPAHLTQPTGIFGPLSRAKANSILSSQRSDLTNIQLPLGVKSPFSSGESFGQARPILSSSIGGTGTPGSGSSPISNSSPISSLPVGGATPGTTGGSSGSSGSSGGGSSGSSAGTGIAIGAGAIGVAGGVGILSGSGSGASAAAGGSSASGAQDPASQDLFDYQTGGSGNGTSGGMTSYFGGRITKVTYCCTGDIALDIMPAGNGGGQLTLLFQQGQSRLYESYNIFFSGATVLGSYSQGGGGSCETLDSECESTASTRGTIKMIGTSAI